MMKKILSVLLAVSATVSLLCLFAVADDSSEVLSEPVQEGYSTAEIAITAVIMFIVISVIGVMFIKTVQKDRNKLR